MMFHGSFLVTLILILGTAVSSLPSAMNEVSHDLVDKQYLSRRFVVMGYTPDTSGSQSAFNAFAVQLNTVLSHVPNQSFGATAQETRDVTLSFRSALNTFLSCNDCFANNNLVSFAGVLQHMFARFQALMDALKNKFGDKWKGLFFDAFSSFKIDGLFNNLLLRINGAQQLKLGQFLPAGIADYLVPLGLKLTVSTLRDLGY